MPFAAFYRYLEEADEVIPWEWASEVCQSIADMRALYSLSAGAWDGYDLETEEGVWQAVQAQWPHLMVPYGAVPGGDWTFANRATIASDELGISSTRVGALLSTNAFTSATQIETYDYWNCLRVLIDRLENPVPWPLASDVLLALQERAAVYDRDDWPGHDLSTQEGVYQALAGYQYPHWGRIALMWDTDLSAPTLGMGLGWPSGYASTLYPPTIHTPVPLYHEDYWLGIAAMLPHMRVAYLAGTKVSRIEYAGVDFDSRFESPPEGESCDSYYDVPFTEDVVAGAAAAYAVSPGYALTTSSTPLLAANFTAYRQSQVVDTGTWAALSVVESIGSVVVPAWCAARAVEWTLRMGFERLASSTSWDPTDGMLDALGDLPGSENFFSCGYTSTWGGEAGYRWEPWLLQLGAGGDTLASCLSVAAGSGGLTEIDFVFELPAGLVQLCSTFDMSGAMSPWGAELSPRTNYGYATARPRGPALLIADVSAHLTRMI